VAVGRQLHKVKLKYLG